MWHQCALHLCLTFWSVDVPKRFIYVHQGISPPKCLRHASFVPFKHWSSFGLGESGHWGSVCLVNFVFGFFLVVLPPTIGQIESGWGWLSPSRRSFKFWMRWIYIGHGCLRFTNMCSMHVPGSEGDMEVYFCKFWLLRFTKPFADRWVLVYCFQLFSYYHVLTYV